MTISEYIEFLEGAMERVEIRAQILQFVTNNQGKGLRSNMLPDPWYVSKTATMTHLCVNVDEDGKATDARAWADYSHTEMFVVDWKTTGVIVPSPAQFKERNTQAFEGLDLRNAKRQAILGCPKILAAHSSAISTGKHLVEQYWLMRSTLLLLMTDHPDGREIEKAIGLLQPNNLTPVGAPRPKVRG